MTVEVQQKVITLPCVANGDVKTNVSAKLMALVSDKRREFEDAANTTTRRRGQATSGHRGTELIRWINLSQIRFRIWPAALTRSCLLRNARVASKQIRRRKAGPRMNGRHGRRRRGRTKARDDTKQPQQC